MSLSKMGNKQRKGPSFPPFTGKGGGGNMTNTKIVYPKSENCQRLGDGSGPARR